MPDDKPGSAPPEVHSMQPDPAGLVLLPHGVADGEALLPFAVSAGVGLTPPDKAGRRYATLQISDGTLSVTLRLPWQNADQFGAGIAQGLAAVKARAEAEQGPSLIVPNGAGRFLVPNGPVPPGAAVRG